MRLITLPLAGEGRGGTDSHTCRPDVSMVAAGRHSAVRRGRADAGRRAAGHHAAAATGHATGGCSHSAGGCHGVLVRRVRDLDPSTEKASLERHISDAMLEATDATFAALVEWSSRERSGTVRYVSAMYPDSQTAIESAVAESSMVGDVCAMRTPVRWENEARRATKTTLYGPGLHAPSAGAIAIFPMARAKEIIGAIVLGSKEAGALREGDLRGVGLFAHLAGSAIEAAWGIEEVTGRRASTSSLDSATAASLTTSSDSRSIRPTGLADVARSCWPTSIISSDVNDDVWARSRVTKCSRRSAGDQVRTAGHRLRRAYRRRRVRGDSSANG